MYYGMPQGYGRFSGMNELMSQRGGYGMPQQGGYGSYGGPNPYFGGGRQPMSPFQGGSGGYGMGMPQQGGYGQGLGHLMGMRGGYGMPRPTYNSIQEPQQQYDQKDFMNQRDKLLGHLSNYFYNKGTGQESVGMARPQEITQTFTPYGG